MPLLWHALMLGSTHTTCLRLWWEYVITQVSYIVPESPSLEDKVTYGVANLYGS